MGSVNFAFILNTFHILIYLTLGMLIGGLHMAWSRLPLLLFVLLLSALAFSCIGIFSASYCVVFKKGNPVAWLLTALSSLLGGVYYPKSVLPHWLQSVAAWVPMTHCLEALRGVLLQGKGLTQVSGSLLILATWSIIGLPLSYLTFRWAVNRGRQTGSLGLY
jgi:ABC-2 type transport system permease protein